IKAGRRARLVYYMIISSHLRRLVYQIVVSIISRHLYHHIITVCDHLPSPTSSPFFIGRWAALRQPSLTTQLVTAHTDHAAVTGSESLLFICDLEFKFS
ncbi:hypothetical protein, partial [Thiolapillus sp.]|uniref:hypothetical protein n=1 Tax=Thiolapillus sp. TaxID=2017437 RepID=UPI003AF8883F